MKKQKRNKIPVRVKLTDCTACHQPFVVPIVDECREVGDDHWHMVLRCGACGDMRETMVTQAEADHFDVDLDVYLCQLERDLRRLTAENMEREARIFARALEADAILPEDFRV